MRFNWTPLNRIWNTKKCPLQGFNGSSFRWCNASRSTRICIYIYMYVYIYMLFLRTRRSYYAWSSYDIRCCSVCERRSRHARDYTFNLDIQNPQKKKTFTFRYTGCLIGILSWFIILPIPHLDPFHHVLSKSRNVKPSWAVMKLMEWQGPRPSGS